ncbi:MAG: transposase [Panacibacter sp.]
MRQIESKYSFLGKKSYSPHLLLKLLFYGYSTGIHSGRKIAAACEQDTAFMYLASMYKPDFRTINDFRKDNIEFIQHSFMHIVQLCKGLGMCRAGIIILDGTKLKDNANASRTKNKEQYEQWIERIDSDIKIYLKMRQKPMNGKMSSMVIAGVMKYLNHCIQNKNLKKKLSRYWKK